MSAPREERMLEDIARSSGCVEHGGVSVRADMSLVEEAHGNGLSLGKYLAYQVLLRYEPTVTVEDCHEMSMSQISGRIEEHEHGANHGNGHDRGHGGHETEPERGDEAGTGNEMGNGIIDENSRHDDRPGESSTVEPAEQPTEHPTEHHAEQ